MKVQQKFSEYVSVEEAIGTAVDLWTAYREGAYSKQPRPFVGWLMLLEDTPESRVSVRDHSPNFEKIANFENISYAGRYNNLYEKLVQEQLYNTACLGRSVRYKRAPDC